MSFDTLAPHYGWMEWLLAGRKLQQCRTAFLPEVQQAQRVLLLGEGNGRFLGAFARANSSANITVVDASAAMLRAAKQRAAAIIPESERRIQCIHADALNWSPPGGAYDLIVSNFFLDCFRADQLAGLVPRLAAAASADAQWIVCDFCLPARGLARWRAQGIVALMYCFFRTVTRLPARSLTPVDPLLQRAGFELRGRILSEWGLLHADRWQRASGNHS
jgi:SAM-dependent methyltransferase